jgi:hypothetical protein
MYRPVIKIRRHFNKSSASRAVLFIVLAAFLSSLIPIAAPAIETRWANPISGNWRDAVNWTPSLPLTGDTAIIDVTGQPYRVRYTFTPFQLAEIRLLSTDATLWFTNSTLTLDGTLFNQATIEVFGDSRIDVTDFVQRGELKVIGAPASQLPFTRLRTDTFTNEGLITLTSEGGEWPSQFWGGLVNEGTLRFEAGSGGGRSFLGTLLNRGRIEVETATELGPGTYTNEGLVRIQSAARMEAVGLPGNQTWNQNAGLLDVQGSFTGEFTTFNFNGGAVQGHVELTKSTLNIAEAAEGNGTFSLIDGGQLNGFIPMGTQVELDRRTTQGTNYISSAGVTNLGNLMFVGRPFEWSLLNAPGIALTNAETGVITFNSIRDLGPARITCLTMANEGRIAIQHSAEIFYVNLFDHHGDIEVDDGQVLKLGGSPGASFQHSGTIRGAGLVSVETGAVVHKTGENFVPMQVVTVDYRNYVSGTGNYLFRGNGRVQGGIPLGQILTVAGPTANGSAGLAPFTDEPLVNPGLITLGILGEGPGLANFKNGVNEATGTIQVQPTARENAIIALAENRGRIRVDGPVRIDGNTTNLGSIQVRDVLRVTGTFRNEQTLEISEGGTLVGDFSATFAHQSGTLIVDGLAEWNGTMRLAGGTIAGGGLVRARILELDAPTNEYKFEVTSTVRYLPNASGSAEIKAFGIIPIFGDVPAHHSIISLPSEFISTPELRSIAPQANSGTITAEFIRVNGALDALTNTGTGVVNFTGGQGLDGNLINEGTLNFSGVTFSPNFHSRIGLINRGTVEIAEGSAWEYIGALQHLDGAFNSLGVFQFTGPGQLNLDGPNFNGNIVLRDSRVHFGAKASGSATFELGRSTRLSGVIPSGFTLAITADNTTSVIGDLANHGLLRITAPRSRVLYAPGATFTNLPAGVLELASADVGGPVINQGQMVLSGESFIRLRDLENEGTIASTAIQTVFDDSDFVNRSAGSMFVSGRFDFRRIPERQFVNEGALHPGHHIGTFTIGGAFSQAESGSLYIDLSGRTAAAEYDQLILEGSVSMLGGMLHVNLADGFLPAPSDVFTILDSRAAFSGRFSNPHDKVILAEGAFDILYDTTQVRLMNFEAIPEPGTIVLAITTLIALAVLRVRDVRRVHLRG